MNAYSLMAKLRYPTNEGSAAFEARQPILLPRIAADDLPPYHSSHAESQFPRVASSLPTR